MDSGVLILFSGFWSVPITCLNAQTVLDVEAGALPGPVNAEHGPVF